MTTAKRHTHTPFCDRCLLAHAFLFRFFRLDFNWNKLTRDYLRALVIVNAVHRPKFWVHFTHAPTWIHVINGSGIIRTLDFISSSVRCCCCCCPLRRKTFLCDTLRQMHVLHLQFKCAKVEKCVETNCSRTQKKNQVCFDFPLYYVSYWRLFVWHFVQKKTIEIIFECFLIIFPFCSDILWFICMLGFVVVHFDTNLPNHTWEPTSAPAHWPSQSNNNNFLCEIGSTAWYMATPTEHNWHWTKRETEIIEMNTKNYNFLLDKILIRDSIRFNRRTIVISMKVNLLVHNIYGANENGRMACGIKITGTSRKIVADKAEEKKRNVHLIAHARTDEAKGSEENRWDWNGEGREMKKKGKDLIHRPHNAQISEHFNILYWLCEPFQW